eukprot:SAG31_NODE_2863_length_4982_cov_2.545361_1_plen_193_part_00
MADRDAEAEDLLELELHVRFHLVQLLVHALRVGEQRRELASLIQTGAEQAWDLLDERLRSKEHGVLLGKFLNELLVLVEILHALDVNLGVAFPIGLFTAFRITNNADVQVGSRTVLQLDGSVEALVLLRIVVLEAHLQLDRLLELPLDALGDHAGRVPFVIFLEGDRRVEGLALRELQGLADALAKEVAGKL